MTFRNCITATTARPLGMAVQPTPATVKKGATVEILATVTRQGGYTGPVQVQFVQLPASVTSLLVTVPPEANQGKLVITAAANAAAGSFTNVILRATAQVGGQAINIDTPFTLQIE